MDTERDTTPSKHADDAVFGGRAMGTAGRWWRGVIALAVLSAAVFVAWYASRDGGPSAEPGGHVHGAAAGAGAGEPVMLDAEQARRIGVTYATVERTVLRQEVRTVAQVTFDETRVRTVSMKFDGWVDRLHVDFTGMEVRAGESLLSTYSPMLTSAEQELVVAAKLVRDLSAADEVQRRSAQEMLLSARQRLLNWDVPQAEVERVERTGEVPRTLVIRTPYSGVIAEKLVTEGQRIMAGDPLYRIADLSVVWVEGEVFERDLPLVRIGQTVEIELEARPGTTRRGRVVFLQPTVSAETRTVRLRVALDNANGELKPGMYATVRIASVGDVAVLNVPRSAVLSTGRRDLVFVRRADGMLEPRDIVHGIATDDRVEVRSGLRAGETVVASATFLIDAESNLGSALGGMGGMPGMDVTSPPTKAPPMPGMKHDQ
ncbi:MAG: efflux RND transporter periplasmic adaptor subunit [Gemmatimonadetes bacterium]|nr:efflux RND transporter periplasmic adaptor subunit [Gemmatimonadota bacterium]